MHRRTTSLTASLAGTAVLGATFLAAPTALAAGGDLPRRGRHDRGHHAHPARHRRVAT